jgi:hypothetical protein
MNDDDLFDNDGSGQSTTMFFAANTVSESVISETVPPSVSEIVTERLSDEVVPDSPPPPSLPEKLVA